MCVVGSPRMHTTAVRSLGRGVPLVPCEQGKQITDGGWWMVDDDAYVTVPNFRKRHGRVFSISRSVPCLAPRAPPRTSTSATLFSWMMG